jgi:hypothetical protein
MRLAHPRTHVWVPCPVRVCVRPDIAPVSRADQAVVAPAAIAAAVTVGRQGRIRRVGARAAAHRRGRDARRARVAQVADNQIMVGAAIQDRGSALVEQRVAGGPASACEEHVADLALLAADVGARSPSTLVSNSGRRRSQKGGPRHGELST